MDRHNDPVDIIELSQAKRHIVADKIGIPLSTVITSVVNTYAVMAITDDIDNLVATIF